VNLSDATRERSSGHAVSKASLLVETNSLSAWPFQSHALGARRSRRRWDQRAGVVGIDTGSVGRNDADAERTGKGFGRPRVKNKNLSIL
jgi:hypothetical protein